jgi:hypothetical protein
MTSSLKLRVVGQNFLDGMTRSDLGDDYAYRSSHASDARLAAHVRASLHRAQALSTGHCRQFEDLLFIRIRMISTRMEIDGC